jgi:2-methylcitrate dehydratase PrpD
LILRNENNVRAEAVRSVEILIYPAGYDLLDGVQPTTAYAAKFCLPYTVAAGLIRGRVSLTEFEDLNARDIRSTMSRITMVRDESLGAHYPEKWPARLTATMESGESFSASVEYPKGDAKNPLTLPELEDKFRALTERILSPERQERIIKVINQIESHQTADIFV